MTTTARPCSIADALHAVGEKWALLTIRELFLGNRRFAVIQRNTGAPRDRLAARLKALEAAGVVERRLYSERPPRYEYRLTDAGLDLAPVLITLRQWGEQWATDGPPPMTYSHGADVHEVVPVLVCRTCGEQLSARPIHAHPEVPGWTLAGPAPTEAAVSP